MNNNNGRLSYGVSLDNSQLRTGANESKRILSGIGQTAVDEGRRIDDTMNRIGKTVAGVFAVAQMKEFVTNVANVRGEFQKLEISFKTMLGSEEKAVRLMDQLVKTAATTPFSMGDIANSAKQLLAYGLEAEKVNDTLIRLGDIAAGLSIPINDLAYLYGTTMVQGRLYTQDLNQFLGRGIPLMAELAKQFGVAESEVKKLVEEGKVGFPQVQQAIVNLTSEGSKFGGLMEAQSKTIAGQISNIEDQIEQMFNEIGKSSEGAISGALSVTSEVIEHWEEIGKVLLTVIATYGAYKAAVIAVAAAHKLMALWQTAQAFLSLVPAITSAKDAMILFNMVCRANPLGLVLSVLAAAVTAFALFADTQDDTEEAIKNVNERIKAQEQELKELQKSEDAVLEAKKNAAKRTAEEISKIESLNKTIHDETASLNDRKKALTQMQAIVPKYHAELDTEGRLHRDNTEAIEAHIESLNRLAVAKALQAKREEFVARRITAELERGKAQENVSGATKKRDAAQAVVSRKQASYNSRMRELDNATGKGDNGFLYNMFVGGAFASKEGQITYSTTAKEYRKSLDDAEKVLRLRTSELQAATNEVRKQDLIISQSNSQLTDIDNMMKNYGAYLPSTNTGAGSGSGGSGGSGSSSKDNKQALADAAAQRALNIREYAENVKSEVIQAELDIRQAQIDAMDVGFEKSIAQVQLNYDRLTVQNLEREKKMIEDLKDKKVLEWQNDNPNATEEQKINYRESLNLTVNDLSAEQQAILKSYSDLAVQYQIKGNRQALEEILKDVQTYEQQRLKIQEDYADKRKALYVLDAEGNSTGQLKAGVTQGNVDELDRAEREALSAVDEQFAQREDSYQAWCNEIATLSLEQLRIVLQQAEDELKKLEKSGASDTKLAQARAKVQTAQKAVQKEQAKTNVSPDKRSIKEWQDLYKTLNECTRSFKDIGDAVGGTVGEVISAAGEIATSTLSMINGIVQLVQMSSTAMTATASTASKAIQTVEKASVILAVISAALQVTTAIANLFNNDEAKQKEIEKLQGRIDQLQWELDHAEIIRLQENSGKAIDRVKQALSETYNELLRNKIALNDWAGVWSLLFGKTRNNTELLTKTANKLATAYGNIAYTADKALGGKQYENARQQLENIAQQQILIQEQIRQEEDKKKTDHNKIQDWEQQIEELGQQAIEIINEMVEDIIGGSSSDIAEQLSDAFFEAFQNGEDYAEAWGDKVNEIVADVMKRMLVQKYLEEPLGEIFDKYKAKWFKDGQFVGLQAVIDSMSGFAADLNAVGEDFQAIWESLPDSVKNWFTVTDATREASQKGIATASQESVDELNGRATAIQGHTYSISENTKLLLASVNLILQSVLNIERHTEAMAEQVSDVRLSVKEVKDTVNDIALKGIKLK
jgi:tape measure domain-containing protein